METTGPVMSRQDGKTTCLSLRSTSGPRYGSISDPPLTEAPPAESRVISPKRSYIAVAVLCYVNLINYIDRYTIAGETSHLDAKQFDTHECWVGFIDQRLLFFSQRSPSEYPEILWYQWQHLWTVTDRYCALCMSYTHTTIVKSEVETSCDRPSHRTWNRRHLPQMRVSSISHDCIVCQLCLIVFKWI